MGLLSENRSEAQARHLEFLVIGGLAVLFYGHSRDTADLDLLVRVADRPAWLDLFGRLGYAIQRDADAF